MNELLVVSYGRRGRKLPPNRCLSRFMSMHSLQNGVLSELLLESEESVTPQKEIKPNLAAD